MPDPFPNRTNSVPDGQGLPAEAGLACPSQRSLLFHRLSCSSADTCNVVLVADVVAVLSIEHTPQLTQTALNQARCIVIDTPLYKTQIMIWHWQAHGT